MHGAVGTALGGVCTIVGEPQNLLIATKADWSFIEFFLRMAPVTIPVLFFGILTCIIIEKLKLSEYGAQLPSKLRDKLIDAALEKEKNRTNIENTHLVTVSHFRHVTFTF